MRILTAASFSTIMQYVLREGDRQTYCDSFTDNPHVRIAAFDVFLNPSIGKRNKNCDPEQSRFDELVIRDDRAPGYRRVKCVGDELRYEKKERDALEYYFAVLIAHISALE